jgi:hypothetical protein
MLDQSVSNLEFIIVNDGSTDGSADILDRYARADRRVRVLHQANRGVAASRNRAIGEARAPLVAVMDGDDVAMPDRFDIQVQFLDAHLDYGAVGCQVVLIDPCGRVIGPGVPYPTDHIGFLQALENSPLMIHPGALIRRNLLVAIGGYRSIFRYGPDYDLWLRLSSITKLCSVSNVLLHYRVNPDQVSSRNLLEQKINAAIAWEAYLERRAGRPDPIAGLQALPAVACLDQLFGRNGVSRAVRDKVTPQILFSKAALSAGGALFIRDYVRDGGDRAGLWRTCLRLLKMGMPVDAIRLSMSLARSTMRECCPTESKLPAAQC